MTSSVDVGTGSVDSNTGASNTSGRQVLLIDDNTGDIELFRELLRAVDPMVSCLAETDGDDALRMLQSPESLTHPPDVIVLDLNLPGMSGVEILQQLRSRAHLQLIPVIVLSTSAATIDVDRAYELGATSFINKPSRLAGMRDVVRAIAGFCVERSAATLDDVRLPRSAGY